MSQFDSFLLRPCVPSFLVSVRLIHEYEHKWEEQHRMFSGMSPSPVYGFEVLMDGCGLEDLALSPNSCLVALGRSLVVPVTKQMRGQGMLQWSVLNDGGSCAEF